LAGERVDQRLEHRRETRRLQAVEELHEAAVARFVSRRAIEQTGERRHRHQSGGRRQARTARRHVQHRTLQGRGLHDLHRERALVDDQNLAIGRAVPAIDGVERPPAQRLNREVETKGRDRLDLEDQPIVIRGRLPDLPIAVNATLVHQRPWRSLASSTVSRASAEWA
jgi:hypothetical protein